LRLRVFSFFIECFVLFVGSYSLLFSCVWEDLGKEEKKEL